MAFPGVPLAGRAVVNGASEAVSALLSIKIEKLRTFLRNSPAANLVEEKIEKTAISIRAVLTNYVKAIRYLQGIEHNGESFMGAESVPPCAYPAGGH